LKTRDRGETAALYVRLSRDDGTESESNSIMNQKKLLTRAAKEKGFKNLLTFTDDGFTGVTMDRAGFRAMIEQLEKGYISTVFIKDRSRLGRNYVELGRLTQELLPELDIRLIAVGEGTDTAEGEDDMAPFRDVMNEYTSRDISRKVKSSYRVRGTDAAGFPIGMPPYGYTRDPDDPRRWAVDPEAADVVREIFSGTLDGRGVEQIAAELERRQILTPSNYRVAKKMSGRGRANPAAPYGWSMQTVAGILDRREYCGDVVNFKTYKKSFKKKKRLENAPEDMVIFESVHEAIVPRETWERVRQLRAAKTRKKPGKTGEVSIFSGLLRCADCGANLHYHFNQKNPEIHYFNCPNNNRVRKTCASTHYIRVDFLEQVLLREIRQLTWFASKRENDFAALITGAATAADARETARLRRELTAKKSRDLELDTLFERLYEDNVAGKVDDSRFSKQSARYDEEQRELAKTIQTLTDAITRRRDKAVDARDFLTTVRKYTRARKLTARLLIELIDHIDVYQQETSDGKRSQRLGIHYRCVGEVRLPAEAPGVAVEMETRQGVALTYTSGIA
jgi:hypothetical protein